MKNTVDGIDKLFTNKNNTLHKLVDDAQYQARIYSQQVFNKSNRTENDTASDSDEVNHLATTESYFENKTLINQNLSTFFKSDYPANSNQTNLSPNEVYSNENDKNSEYRQITTPPSNEISENLAKPTNQGESIGKLNEDVRFNEFNSFIVSEEENMQNQLEIDKKINESLNRANYLTSTTTTSTTTVKSIANKRR